MRTYWNHKPAVIIGFIAIFLTALPPIAAWADFAPIAGWDRHLFPAYIVATAAMRATPEDRAAPDRTATLGDPHGLLGVSLQAPADNASVKVTVASDAILEPSSFTATLAKKGERYKIFPPIKYKFPALVRNKQTVPITVTYRVEFADRDPEEQTLTLTLRSINDCPMAYDEGEKTVDISYVFAAYVNEEHPQIEKILKDALALGVVDSFAGYSEDGPEDVLRQVYALWHVLSKRGVHYSNSTTTAGESESVNSQHVRMIEESIDNV